MAKTSYNKFAIASLIATVFNVGNIKWAPGTFGSLVVFPFWLLLNILILKLNLGHFMWVLIIYAAFFAAVTYAGFWAVDVYVKTNKKDDPSEVVIDEVSGQLLAYIIPTLFTVFYFTYMVGDILVTPIYSCFMTFNLTILPILLFRFFDICKFGMVRYYDMKVKGAKGIMMDDIVAGVQAGIIISALIFFMH